MKEKDLGSECRRVLPSIIIGSGVVLRLLQYFFDRSLSGDEAAMALNVMHRSLPGFLQPLSLDQAAPPLFLMIEKFFISTLGTNDYALRLFPLLCGCLALPIFFKVSKTFLNFNASLLALALVSFSAPLIYYSSEVKPYSTDLFVTLILYAATASPALFAFTGAVAIWLSYPAIFVFVGLGTAMVLERKVRPLLLPASIWILSFSLEYLIYLKRAAMNPALLRYWAGSFIPFSRNFFQAENLSTFLQIFHYPVGLQSYLVYLGAFLFCLGCFSFASREKNKLLCLLLPLGVTLLASALHKYPFFRINTFPYSGRLLIFLVPSLSIMIAKGAEYLVHKPFARSLFLKSVLVAAILFPVLTSKFLREPMVLEQIKPVMLYIKVHQKPDDLIYVYHGASSAFEYYSEIWNYKTHALQGINGREDPALYKQDLERLRGHERVWILFSHILTQGSNQEAKLIESDLDALGKKRDSFVSIGAAAYLYDLSGRK